MAYEYNCRVRRVVDGDTVDVDIDLGFDIILSNQRIRLYGIDTPESRTRDKTEKIYGKLATKYVENYLVKGEKAVLKTRLDKTGKFGRILGEFIVYDKSEDRYQSMNEMMIRDHMAVRYHGQSKEAVQLEHIENRILLGSPHETDS
jgi:micrococcal nuclease